MQSAVPDRQAEQHGLAAETAQNGTKPKKAGVRFSSAQKLSESRKSRILSALQVMVRGGRAGVALEALMRFYRETNDALMASYQFEADARAEGRADPTDRVERGHLWMLRNDLRGYVLLGDPAARLPTKVSAVASGCGSAPANRC